MCPKVDFPNPFCRVFADSTSQTSLQIQQLHADIMHVVISHTDICDDSVTREHGYNVNKNRLDPGYMGFEDHDSIEPHDSI